MPDVTKELWSLYVHEGAVQPKEQVILRTGDERDLPYALWHGYGGDPEDTGEGRARARMASMAPTFFRMLERVLQSATLSPELEESIRINLHRASPDTHGMPEPPKDPPRSSWERLLGDPPV